METKKNKFRKNEYCFILYFEYQIKSISILLYPIMPKFEDIEKIIQLMGLKKEEINLSFSLKIQNY